MAQAISLDNVLGVVVVVVVEAEEVEVARAFSKA